MGSLNDKLMMALFGSSAALRRRSIAQLDHTSTRGAEACRKAASAVAEKLEVRRLLSGGYLDTSFNSTGTRSTNLTLGAEGGGTAVQSDGKTLAFSGANQLLSSYDFLIQRFTTSGALDSTFGNGGQVLTDFAGNKDVPRSGIVQSDGKLVVAGMVTTGGLLGLFGTQCFGIARYNTDGSLDTSFGTDGTGKVIIDVGGGGTEVGRLNVESDGKFIISGMGNNDLTLVRLNTDGTIDTSFSGDGITSTHFAGYQSKANAVVELSNGDLLAVGAWNPSGGDNYLALACFTSSGSLNTSFNSTGTKYMTLGNTSGSSSGLDAKMQSDGKILIAGLGSSTAGKAGVARINSNGTLDTSFNSTGMAYVNFSNYVAIPAVSLAIQADGKVLIAGAQGMSLARLTSSGAIDTGFGSNGIITNSSTANVIGDGMALTSDGKAVVSGWMAIGIAEARFNITAPPTANAGSAYSVNTQSTVAVSGSLSSDPDGLALTYQWDLNYNGSTFNPTSTSVSATFSAVGISGPTTRTVGLRVTDLLGAVSSISTATVTINNVAPVVTAAASSYSFNETVPVTLSSTVTDIDSTDTYTYVWHVTADNGDVIANATTPSYTFTPNGAGHYNASLTVTDAFGAVVTSNAPTITTLHIAPVPAISGATSASRGNIYTLNLSSPEVGIETISSWSVNWGDGNVQTISGNPSSVTHYYLSSGTTTISASSTDAYGSYNSNTQSVTTATGFYYDMAASFHTAYASAGANVGNVVDGNSSTEWNSGNVTGSPGQWIFVDLGSAYNISQIKLNWGTAYAATYKIRVSIDSANWLDFVPVTNGSAGTNDLSGLNGNARYVLVQMLSFSAGNNSYALKDVQVFGGDDLALNRTTYTSSGGGTTNVVDASSATNWITTAPTNQWAFTDLGEVFNINQAKVYFDTNYASTFSIWTSCDTTSWTQISSNFTGHAGLNVVNGFNGNGRYIMLSMPNAANGVSVKVGDFEVNGGNVLSLNRPATTSSAAGGSSGAQAVDGSTSTAWTSATNGTQSIYTDLGAAYDVTRVKLTFGSNYASAFQIQVSPDATTWATVYSTTTFTGGVLDQGLLYGVGRYVRVLCTAGTGSNYSLQEFEVYGSANLGLNRPSTATSYTTGHGAGYATDQDPGTSWISSSGGSQAITTDLGFNFNITNVTLNFDAAYASTFTISVSSDNINWTTITTVNYGHQGTNMIAGLSGRGRYVKVTMTVGPSNFYQLNDLSIYGN